MPRVTSSTEPASKAAPTTSRATAPTGSTIPTIGNAVDGNGEPANLAYIDFVKVQTGVNAKAGWLGENSTEVFGFTDENLNQGK